MDFLRHFDQYVQPLSPLGVLVGIVVSGAMGGAYVAAKERKDVRLWAARGAAFLSACCFVGGHISAALVGRPGGGLPGMFIGGLIGCISLVTLIIASDH